ncbi:G-type lectin S-receptor-like serine/threonine-protein kinase At4g27290 isoform X2 [Cajanus cajan]|uniref:Receptor-like serine/threonine-protein kinase n=1 Tax=Cajanus cajan TaxID=3821 RepID=A0A151T1Q6_CAJCA|nr:G-type lectin S-receptor-like serine/threonine-protein kinase At4g27290 isoform X2 [Cajanus cajan]KYP60967.1 Putative serine/threonine-protein kinase receptor [Cajanus cajan]
MALVHATLLFPNLLFFFFSQVSYATDTITHSQPLSDGSTLVSKDGTFELGFFTPGSSTNRYVGIWFKNIQTRTIVWVANRNNPTKDKSSTLSLTEEGNLVLLNINRSLVWSTNTTSKEPVSSLVVQLLDSGNLVIRDGSNDKNEESFLWESFDHPCDTLLQGMKLGWNLKTGLNRFLTAWKNWDDPSSGDFTSGVKLGTNPELAIWKGSVEYYRSGPWNGIFSSGVFGFSPNPLFEYKYVQNEDEVYVRYTLKNSSVVSIIVLNQTLYLRQRITWIPHTRTWSVYQSLPQDSCDVYNVCGAYGSCMINGSPVCQCLEGFKPKSVQNWNAMDWTQGCVHKEPWSCGVKNKDGFRRFVGMKMPDTTHSWINTSMTLEDCKAKCLNICSCTAYANLDTSGGGSGCSIWFGDLVDLRVSESGQDLYVRMATSDTIIYNDAKHKNSKKVVLMVAIIVSLVVMMLMGFSYIYMTKTKKEEEKDEGEQENLELPFFDLATIINATNNFSIVNKLGEGGFGPVYKGTMLDGQVIAVKRLSRSSGQGLKEFKNEVILCAKLQHRNLVKVLGCCIEGEEKMLLYEYMPNKSLDSFIFDSVQSKLLDWPMRFNILCAIARGLMYLHQDSRLRIIHRDLKASNILLDNNMNPKISDFGLAKMCGGDQVEGNTNRIVGTYGYMAPEYAIDGLFSTKSDVFSFGVLLLEIISGKKNRTITNEGHIDNLIGHAWRMWKEGTPEQLIAPSLVDSCKISEVIRCIQVGLLCLQHHPDDRPNMTSVIVMLSSETILSQPKVPSFLIKNISIEGEQSCDRQESCSINEVTVSLLNAR